MKEVKKTSVIESIIVMLLVIGVIVGGLRMGIGSQMSLFLGSVVATAAAMYFRNPWDDIQKAILEVITNSTIAILILMIVGVMIGAWIIGGTVPSLMYYGLKMCTPQILLPLTFVLCSVMSVFTGTSFGSIATMGLALVGVAQGMGMPTHVVAGAVVSGAYFGDKLSPMSDNTNMASAMTGATLYEHIGSMMYTTLPASLITIVIYYFLGLRYSSGVMDSSNIDLMMTTLSGSFNISLVAILPAILMLVVSALKIPAVPGLSGCALASILFAVVLQDVSLKEVFVTSYAGFKSQTGVALVDTILSRGGMASMFNTVALIIIAGIMGGALNVSGVLKVFVEEGLLRVVNKAWSLVVATMVYSYFILLVSGNQVLGLVMAGPTFQPAYKDMDLHPKVLSRALADTTTVAAPLVPWSTACNYTIGVLGIGIGYIPYAFLCYIVPVFTVLLAVTGICTWRTDGTPYRSKHANTVSVQ